MEELGILVVSDRTYLDYPFIPSDIVQAGLFEITTKGGVVYIQAAVGMTCLFCGRLGTKEIGNKWVCPQCIKQLKKIRRKRK